MIFKSMLPRIKIPDVDIVEYVFTQARINYAMAKKKTEFAICDGPSGKSLSIGDIEEMTAKLSSGLVHRLNFKRDQVGMIFSANSLYYPIFVYSILSIGGIVTLANPSYTPRELAYQLKDSSSRVIACERKDLNIVKEAIHISKLNYSDLQIILIDINQSQSYKPKSDILASVYSLDKKSDTSLYLHEFSCDLPFEKFRIYSEKEANEKVAVLPYSSGTTGLPKGVMLTHKNVVSSMLMNSCFAVNDGWIDRDEIAPKFIGVLPFYHIYGFVSILNLGIAMVNTFNYFYF
ncbi:4-coumarate-CoA ligase-like 7 [Smittium culicis]|uniref:4-coumarate-CoA ligase-like 7 n=1 Tax=Smittium culicis TaxID=133412 RepID=A0A1R1Y0K2_9FUNG|nr:4-coumarate-CoA ligase-like 7 [Smittium culicis]